MQRVPFRFTVCRTNTPKPTKPFEVRLFAVAPCPELTTVSIAKRPVRPFTIDLTDSPDLFPVLAALAAFGKKPSTLKGIHRLKHKESHRALRIAEAWEKLGIQAELDEANDSMRVHP